MNRFRPQTPESPARNSRPNTLQRLQMDAGSAHWLLDCMDSPNFLALDGAVLASMEKRGWD